MILKNKMEVIRWENSKIPAVILPHPRRASQYIFSHWHRELEITCLFEGEVSFYNGGVCRTLKSGGVNISNSGEMHYAVPGIASYDDDNEIAGITLLIDHSFLHGLMPDLDHISFQIKSKKAEKELADQLQYIYALHCKNQNPQTAIRIYAAVCELAALLYENCRTEKSVIPVMEQRYRERTESLIGYINDHYQEKLSQRETAEKFHFSREYFARFFKKQTGMTYKKYVTLYRLEKAREELIHKNSKISDIALQNGFSSETQFISSFKNVFGLTPLKYRKLYCEDVPE